MIFKKGLARLEFHGVSINNWFREFLHGPAVTQPGRVVGCRPNTDRNRQDPSDPGICREFKCGKPAESLPRGTTQAFKISMQE